MVDPGPDDVAHLDAIVAAVGDARVSRILLTHGHPDHSEGARALAERLRAPVAALDPAHRLGDEGLTDGDVLEAGGLEVVVVATPGHTGDSLSFHVPADGALLTGDTVLGRGSTVVAHPDGRLGDYLASLRTAASSRRGDRRAARPARARTCARTAGRRGDGVPRRTGRSGSRRSARSLVRLGADASAASAAIDAGPGTDWWHSRDHLEPDLADQVVADVYADVPKQVWPAARLSVLAQLAYLRDA